MNRLILSGVMTLATAAPLLAQSTNSPAPLGVNRLSLGARFGLTATWFVIRAPVCWPSGVFCDRATNKRRALE